MIKVRKEKEGYLVSLYELRKINTLFSDALGEELSEIAENKGVKIYFDLSRINFIDSAGFSMLKEISQKAQSNSSEFILCNLSAEVKELIQLPDVQNYFKICEKEFEKEKVLVNVR
ncbi:MAG: STAS domain-containing protein [Bacteroidales bacterium]